MTAFYLAHPLPYYQASRILADFAFQARVLFEHVAAEVNTTSLAHLDWMGDCRYERPKSRHLTGLLCFQSFCTCGRVMLLL